MIGADLLGGGGGSRGAGFGRWLPNRFRVIVFVVVRSIGHAHPPEPTSLPQGGMCANSGADRFEMSSYRVANRSSNRPRACRRSSR